MTEVRSAIPIRKSIPVSVSVLLFLTGSFVLWCFSPETLVTSVEVAGTAYYTDQEVIDMTDLAATGNRLLSGFLLERKLEQDSWIQDASVFKNGSIVSIVLKETPVLGYDQQEDKLQVLDRNGNSIPISLQKSDRIRSLYPRLENLSDTQKEGLVQACADDPDLKTSPLWSKLAKITSAKESYDPNRLALVFSDGTTLYAGLQDLSLLTSYPAILPYLGKEPACLVLDARQSTAAKMSCSYLAMSADERNEDRLHMLEKLEEDRQNLEKSLQDASDESQQDQPKTATYEDPSGSDAESQAELDEDASLQAETSDDAKTDLSAPDLESAENLQTPEASDQHSNDKQSSDSPAVRPAITQEEAAEIEDWQASAFDWLLYSPSTGFFKDLYDGSLYTWNNQTLSFDSVSF